MAFKLTYRATCEYCDETIETKAYSAFGANAEFQRQGWETVGNELETSQHYCPFHTKHSRHEKE